VRRVCLKRTSPHAGIVAAVEHAHRAAAGEQRTTSEEEAERRIWQTVQAEVLAAADPLEVTRRAPLASRCQTQHDVGNQPSLQCSIHVAPCKCQQSSTLRGSGS